jgi:hypothetical protein
MKHTVTNEYSDIHMTGLVGYVNTTYADLVEAFGQPLSGGDKTNSEWIIKFSDGEVATIYDWKEPSTPVYDYDWHIGGNKAEVVKRVAAILGAGANRWSIGW